MNSPPSTGASLRPTACTALQLAALTRAILHKVQVKRSEGHTLQALYRGLRALLLLSCPPSRGESRGRGGEASFRPKRGRTKWLYRGVGNHPAPHSCHLHTVHFLRGAAVDLRVCKAPHLPVAAVEGPGGCGDAGEGPSQPGCPGPGSGGGGRGGAAGAVPESEPGEVGSGPPAGLGVGPGAAVAPVGGGPGSEASAPGGCSVGVAACMIFWRTSRIFSCRHTLEGKMSA